MTDLTDAPTDTASTPPVGEAPAEASRPEVAPADSPFAEDDPALDEMAGGSSPFFTRFHGPAIYLT